VVLLERLSWKAVAWLSGGHAAHVAHIAFSPNGVSQAVVICHRLLSSVTGCCHLSQAVVICYRLLSSVTGCCHLSQAVVICHRLLSSVTGCCHLSQAVVICTYTACRCGCIDCSALTIGLTALAEQLGHRCPPPQACTLPVWMLRGAWRCGLWRVGHCWLNGGCLVQLQASVGIPQPMHCC
jgi:hypothetical protein